MRRDHIASPKLQAQLDAFNAIEIVPGDEILVAQKTSSKIITQL